VRLPAEGLQEAGDVPRLGDAGDGVDAEQAVEERVAVQFGQAGLARQDRAQAIPRPGHRWGKNPGNRPRRDASRCASVRKWGRGGPGLVATPVLPPPTARRIRLGPPVFPLTEGSGLVAWCGRIRRLRIDASCATRGCVAWLLRLEGSRDVASSSARSLLSRRASPVMGCAEPARQRILISAYGDGSRSVSRSRDCQHHSSWDGTCE
jgi:hypothetical protein